MDILTQDGRFLRGAPAEIVAKLGGIVAAKAARRDRLGALLLEECHRVDRYARQIGPEFAGLAAHHLLLSLEEEGVILIRP